MAPFLDPTFRGGDGNVGIMRSPVRAIALPDNRHEAEDESSLRERSSDPLGLESGMKAPGSAKWGFARGLLGRGPSSVNHNERQRLNIVGMLCRQPHARGRAPGIERRYAPFGFPWLA
jgi:hypothetical protein